MPGTSSRVLATTRSSAAFMSRADMPGTWGIMPSRCSLFTPACHMNTMSEALR